VGTDAVGAGTLVESATLDAELAVIVEAGGGGDAEQPGNTELPVRPAKPASTPATLATRSADLRRISPRYQSDGSASTP